MAQLVTGQMPAVSLSMQSPHREHISSYWPNRRTLPRNSELSAPITRLSVLLEIDCTPEPQASTTRASAAATAAGMVAQVAGGALDVAGFVDYHAAGGFLPLLDQPLLKAEHLFLAAGLAGGGARRTADQEELAEGGQRFLEFGNRLGFD